MHDEKKHKMKNMSESYYSVGPYNRNQYKHLSYAKASPDKRYIKILKWYYDNGKADKLAAVSDVLRDTPVVAAAWKSSSPRQRLRGYAVTFFG